MKITRCTVAMASWLLLLVAFGRVRAEPSWLTVESQGGCICRAEQLAQRIEQELAGVRPDALAVAVAIESGMPIRARVKLSAQAEPLGETQVEASSCDEALAAVTAIAALALSAFPQPEPAVAQQAHVTPRAAPLELAASPRLSEVAPLRRDEGLRDRGASRRWRVLAAAGVAAGGSVRTTVLVVAGAAWELGRGELRLLGRYGVPSTNERIEAQRTSLRSDFGAASIARSGRLDYFFNNAGIGAAGPIEAYSTADWDEVIDVNLRGVAYGVQAAYPAMIAQGFGHIVNTASIAGLITFPGPGSYTASKFGVVALSRALRVEAAHHGVRVSVLCPGVVRTAILNGGKFGRIHAGGMSEEARARSIEQLRPMSANLFAHKALAALARNVAVIVIPGWWRLAWYLERFSPNLSLWLAGLAFAKMRREMAFGNVQVDGSREP